MGYGSKAVSAEYKGAGPEGSKPVSAQGPGTSRSGIKSGGLKKNSDGGSLDRKGGPKGMKY